MSVCLLQFELIYMSQTKAASCYGCGTNISKGRIFSSEILVRKKDIPRFQKEILTVAKESATLIPEKAQE